MKILCISDHKDPLVYSSNIKQRFGDVDFVISAGDLDLEYYGFIVSSLNKPLFFVFGNHNLKHIKQYRKEYRDVFDASDSMSPSLLHTFGSTYIGDRIVRSNGLILSGLGGSYRYNKGGNQYTEYRMWLKILKLIPRLLYNRLFHGRFLDILVTHAPPFGIHDKADRCHRGFKSFLWFMRRFKPKYLIHGHIHLYDLNAIRISMYHDTTVINAYDHYLLEVLDG